MEMVKTDNMAAAGIEGPNVLHALRQVGLLVGVAAAIAIGVAVGLWTYKPNFEVLYGSLGDREVSLIIEALEKRNVEYRLDDRTGAIMVPAGKVREVRLQLAGEGLPKSSGIGFEILQQKQEFGTSQFRELTRYQHALEGELARSIMTLSGVESARVHLALHKQSVFVRKRQQPSASVLIDLYSGRRLEEEQIDAITHMVASSIPNLEPARVTVVDETGRLLSSKKRTSEMALNQDQFEYTRRVEESYVQRIEDILAPIVGLTGVRAQVTADMDFTVTEQTQESYNPDLPATRSEQVMEEQTLRGAAEGVPGALSNEPPAEAIAPQVATGEGVEMAQSQTPLSSRKRSTVNYELDRTISHSRLGSGTVKRLSIAVVVDDRMALDDTGTLTRTPRAEEEIQRITALVKEAIGYNAQRGDTVNVINASFTQPEPLEALPEPPIWEQPWVMDIAKLLLGTVVVMVLIFVVLRPALRNLAAARQAAPAALPAGGEGGMAEDKLTLGAGEEAVKLPTPGAYEENVSMVQKAAQEDPKLVAQVVRNWIAND